MSCNENLTPFREFVVSASQAGQRLDAFLAGQFPDYSRTGLQRAIQADGVTVDGRYTKSAYSLHEGQRVSVVVPPQPPDGPQNNPAAKDAEPN